MRQPSHRKILPQMRYRRREPNGRQPQWRANQTPRGAGHTQPVSGMNVGIVDFSWKENSVLIYPNPIQSEAQLEYTLTTTEKLSLELYDASGKKVQSFFIHDTRTEGLHHEILNLDSMLPSGNYMLVLSNGKKQLSVKITKQ